MNIIEPILKALEQKGYEEPTPIQEKAIPLLLGRKDILACAQTGTGKTAAFAIPIIQMIHNEDKDHNGRPYMKGLIVTPTRELAIQIDENLKEYSRGTILRHAVVFGGVKQHDQVRKLQKGVHILVATPGRLLDLIDQGYISLNKVKYFVLDEADRMLDMGFINDIKKLIKLLPDQRQSLFFSATMPENIVELSQSILKNPEFIEVTPASTTAETIQQHLYYTNRSSKPELLLHIIKEKNIDQVLIFTKTKHGADRVAKRLRNEKIKADVIHGNRAQNQRQKALSLFKEGKILALVATDIAARGIDIDKLSYVINYDIPNLPESYVHRIGRSGRAGEEGTAISICEPEENQYIKDIQKLIGLKINVIENNPFPQTEKPMTDAEKKEWEKEKQRRKQEFFANRRSGGNSRSGGNTKSNNEGNSRRDKSEKEVSGKQKHDKKRRDDNSRQENKPKQERQERPAENNFNKATSSEENQSKRSQSKFKPSNSRRSTNASPELTKKYRWPLEK